MPTIFLAEVVNKERKLKSKTDNVLHINFQPKQGTNMKMEDGMLFKKHPTIEEIYYPVENQPDDDHQFIIFSGYSLMKKHPRYPMYLHKDANPNVVSYEGMYSDETGDYWCNSERDPDNPEYWVETLQEARLENIDKRVTMVNGNVSFCHFDGTLETNKSVIITGKEKITRRYYVGKEEQDEQTTMCVKLF